MRAIDGKPTRDMSVFEGTRLLRGQPGSKVTLTVIRGNAADPHEVSLVREKAAGPLVTGRLISLAGRDAPAAKSSNMVDLPLLSPEAGYVRIASFRAGVVEDLRKQIADVSKSGAKSLIIDVRRTAEGPHRERHRGGPPVRQVRHAGDQGGAQGRGRRKPSRRAPATARSRSPSRS